MSESFSQLLNDVRACTLCKADLIAGVRPVLQVSPDAKILIADDVADTGHTLRSVQKFCEGKVGEVRTAVLYEKSHSVVQAD